MNQSVNRRSFLYGASVAGFGVFAGGRRGFAGGAGPNEVLNFACIGVGGKGQSDTQHASHFGRIVAVCDIDEKRAAQNFERFKDAKRYTDYRKLLEEQGSKIDAVTVSTPDHHHAPAAVMAMRMGKHVYCQKPLTHSVWEARLMRETAREEGRVHADGQSGNGQPGISPRCRDHPIGSDRRDPRGSRLDQSSVQVLEAVRPTSLPGPRRRPASPTTSTGMSSSARPPTGPIIRSIIPHNWRGWWDFGTGSLGDMACHTTNLAFMGLKLGLPTRVSAESGEINSETYPAWATITYEFPARDNLPPVKLTWTEGAKDGKRNLPPAHLFPEGYKFSDSGSLFVGSKGKLYSPSDNGADQVLWPRFEFKAIRLPRPLCRESRELTTRMQTTSKSGSRRSARASRPIALSNFAYASTLTESMLLGNVAVRSGESIDYDPASGRITNSSTASGYLKPYFRKGWEI